MRGSCLAVLWLLILTPMGTVGPPEPLVKELMRAYYEGRDKTPPYEDAIKKLAAADAKERARASAWLVEIVAQALKDEQSGAAPWRATPFWGSSGENPARNLRTNIARALAETKEVPASSIPLLRWYFTTEFLPAVQHDAMLALNKLDTPEAEKLRRELVLQPHDNLAVVAEVLQKMTAAKEKLPADRLLPLCQHHRESVRKAARALHRHLGGTELPPFDPQQAMGSVAVRKLLREMGTLLLDPPPKDAPWIVATYMLYDQKKKERGKYDQTGWLLKEDGGRMEILTPFGQRETVRNAVELTRESERENWWTCSIVRGKIEDEVARVEMVRKGGDRESEFSERGKLTGQFQGQGASLYELVLAQRLHAVGKDALAARILLPALETLYRDDGAVDIMRRELGKNYGYQMLVAFAGDRDYARTEKLATTLARHYPETMFHHYAVRLAEELPKRRDDFVKLKLPTPAEWTKLKKKLDREEQIDFLCQRYRLLNYFQMGQPGGYFPGATQYAEPCGIERNASWGLSRGKTEVINPETELTGARWFDDEKTPRGLNLTLKDVPRLSKYLRQDWLIPTVTFWRDFHPGRDLSSTRPLFAGVINGLATRDICKITDWSKLTPAEIDKEIDRINQWALANADKTEVQLKWDSLEDSLASGRGWFRDIEDQVEWFLKRKEPKAYDVMKRMLEHEKSSDYEKSEILRMYLVHDVSRAKDLAPKYLDHKEGYVRFKAALILFQTGAKDRSRSILGETLQTGAADWWAKKAVELLLKDDAPESRAQVVRLFKNQELSRGSGSFHDHQLRSEIMRLCVDAGMKEPLEYYLKQLDNNEVAFSSFGSGDEKATQTSYAQVHARELIHTVVATDPTIQEIAKKHAKDAERIPLLKKWLQEKLAAK
jgi:hypothetical protein